ncbi:MAG TPA: DUF5672 family protein [Polyangiaceae bacterium]|jgi:hypothetical protein|nr:DUF5672 family protein [Polyangiaceae bacterium]
MIAPYAQFLIDFDRKHPGFAHQNSPANTKAAVIVENRALFFLPMVVKNVMFFLGAGWNLHVVYGEHSQRYLEEALADADVNGIKLEGLTCFTRAQRDDLMKSTEFWKLFGEDKVLLFESNSIMCGSHVDEFLLYDFIGAPAGTPESFGLLGGFSLRARRKLIECIVKGKDNGEPEAEFFTRMMRQIGAVNPDFRAASRFAVASTYEGHPVGVPYADDCLHGVDVAKAIVANIRY